MKWLINTYHNLLLSELQLLDYFALLSVFLALVILSIWIVVLRRCSIRLMQKTKQENQDGQSYMNLVPNASKLLDISKDD